MTYNLGNDEDVKRFLVRVNYLIDKKKNVEITEKREKRTLSQNNYLHLILSWFSLESGCNLEYTKTEYFKKLCNPDIFLYEKEDKYVGKVINIKSSSEIDTKEISEAIKKFRNWASNEAGIYLPEPNEGKFLEMIQNEINKNRQWL